MNNKKIYMDVHVIQTLPPSNINRDDTGSPKTAQYGGVRRARVSSQSWKKAIRKYFVENGENFKVGVRTTDIVTYVANKVMKLSPEMDFEVAKKEAELAINNAGVSTSKDHKAKALFFMGDRQADMLAKAVVEKKNNKTDKKELQKILAENPEIDIALFGRMVADAQELNVDATSQVAHAISTHAVQTEFDYFTALDDLSPEDQAGAGMLGNIEYNSSTLYRYANVAIHELNKMIGENVSTVDACKLFVEAFANSLPTGKVNTFANQTLPSFIMVTLREDRPVNLVSAFEQPVQSKNGDGYVVKSIIKLASEYNKASKFVDEPISNFYLGDGEQYFNEIGKSCNNLKNLLESVGEEIEHHLKDAGD